MRTMGERTLAAVARLARRERAELDRLRGELANEEASLAVLDSSSAEQRREIVCDLAVLATDPHLAAALPGHSDGLRLARARAEAERSAIAARCVELRRAIMDRRVEVRRLELLLDRAARHGRREKLRQAALLLEEHVALHGAAGSGAAGACSTGICSTIPAPSTVGRCFAVGIRAGMGGAPHDDLAG